jgi:hypothetical protein
MPSEPETEELIGKTSSPERDPNKTNRFCFWVKEGIIINPFDFVVTEHLNKTRTIGMVTEMSNLTDSESHLTNFISNELGDPTAEPYVERLKAMVAEVTVFRNTSCKIGGRDVEIRMPVPCDMPVCFANEDMVAKAIGMDMVEEKNKIPAGIILQSNGNEIPVFFDSRYLLSPEGAHINVSGISGLATKTSYLIFLINSIYQKIGDKIAVIIFNVKQSDLLHIHEVADNLTDEDKKFYKKLGLEIKQFDDVKYFLPRGSGGTPNSDNPPDNRELYAFTLADVHDRLDLLFADTPDPYYTLDAFARSFQRDWEAGRLRLEGSIGRGRGATPQSQDISTWEDLRNVNHQLLSSALNLHAMVPPRIVRETNRLTSSSLFVNQRGSDIKYLGEEIKKINPGDVFVIDIFRLSDSTQAFVVGDVMRSIEELYREKSGSELPKALIILVDELNSFAPSRSENAITTQIKEIASKGRSRGTVLFGAEQFKSEVHDQIIGNCSVHAIGRTGSAELSKYSYAFLESDVKKSIATLIKGELVLSFPVWRYPIKIVFPRPCCKKMD